MEKLNELKSKIRYPKPDDDWWIRRRRVLSVLLNSERKYYEFLSAYVNSMRERFAKIDYFNNTCGFIFKKIATLFQKSQNMFVKLVNLFATDQHNAQIGVLFADLIPINKYNEYKRDFRESLNKYLGGIKDNSSEYLQIKDVEDTEGITVLEILRFPIERMINYYILNSELLECTPYDHPDRLLLVKCHHDWSVFISSFREDLVFYDELVFRSFIKSSFNFNEKPRRLVFKENLLVVFHNMECKCRICVFSNYLFVSISTKSDYSDEFIAFPLKYFEFKPFDGKQSLNCVDFYTPFDSYRLIFSTEKRRTRFLQYMEDLSDFNSLDNSSSTGYLAPIRLNEKNVIDCTNCGRFFCPVLRPISCEVCRRVFCNRCCKTKIISNEQFLVCENCSQIGITSARTHMIIDYSKCDLITNP